MWWWVAIVACEVLGGPSSDAVGDDDDDDVVDSGSYVTPAGVPDEIECRPFYDTPAPGETGHGSCVTDVVTCGSSIRGTIEGGSSVLSNQYEAAFEWCSGHSTGDDLDGPERVYRLDVPPEMRFVTARLASCETTQLLWYQTDQVCPQERVTCSYVAVGGGLDQSEDILLSGSGILWFVVEGLAGAVGNFELTVECGE